MFSEIVCGADFFQASLKIENSEKKITIRKDGLISKFPDSE